MTGPQPKQPEAKSAPHGAYMYFLGVNDEHERAICNEWLAWKYPNTLARFTTELRVDRLTKDHVVVCLVRGALQPGQRKPVKLSAVVPFVRDVNGVKETAQREYDEESLLKEVVECTPVRCADYWQDGAYEDAEGELRLTGQGGFLEAIGKVCAPACLKWNDGERRGDIRTLRLMWA